MSKFQVFIKLNHVMGPMRPVISLKKAKPGPDDLSTLLPAAKRCLKNVQICLGGIRLDEDGSPIPFEKRVSIKSVPYWQYVEDFDAFVAPLFDIEVNENFDEEPFGFAFLKEIDT